jgi:ABC-type multidrug transport system fused ATPase/permease subunit
MRKVLHHHLQEMLSKDQSFFDTTTKGDLVSRLTLDIGVLQATIADFLAQRGIRSMLEVTLSLVIM